MGRRLGAGLAAAVAVAVWGAPGAQAVSPDVVVEQVYGGGGNSGATYTHDYVRLFNRGGAPVALDGWSVQYASASGTTWQVTPLAGTIQPGDTYLVQQAAGAGGSTPLPAPDATGTVPMSATSGKVALVTTTAALACGADCDAAAGVRDFVGYGTANDFEGTGTAPTLSNTTAALRAGGGAQDTDDNVADFHAAAPDPGEDAPPPPQDVRIRDVQGTQHRSPHAGDAVRTSGVVTAKSANGFWMQDPEPDTDERTSEGVFVFLGRVPAVAVGDAVTVTGTVTEFRAGGASSANLSLTEITSATVSVVSAGNPLPPATTIGAGGRMPPTAVIEDDAAGDVETSGAFDPHQDGLDFYESLEGMRVEVRDAVASGPTSRFGETSFLPDAGAWAALRTPRGGIVLRAGDANPERIVFDDVLTALPSFGVRDALPGPTSGVLDYSFGNFKLLPTSAPPRVDGGLERETTAAAGERELSFATFNVQNLSPADAQAKFDRLAGLVVANLRAPDLISLEEVQDDTGPANDGTVSASATLDRLVEAIAAAGGPWYAYRQIDPVNSQDGGQPGGNIRVAFLYRTDRGLDFVDRPGGDATTPVAVEPGPRLSISPGRIAPADPAWTASRKPLVGEFTYDGRALFVVGNHWNSKGGDHPLFGRFQPPRLVSEAQRVQQAALVHGFVEDLLAEDPGARAIVMGDLNDFPWSPPLQTLIGDPPVLENLLTRLPAEERYTYVFEGNSQALDHILATPAAAEDVSLVDVVHVNAEFADQVSDHDPLVAIGDFSAPEPACDAALGAVGCWAFDEATGPTAFDASPLGNDGTYVNGPLLGVPGVAGTAVSLDGRDDHVAVPDAGSLDVGDSFTLEGWVKRDEDGHSHQLFNKGGRGFQLLVMSRFDGNQVWLRKAGSSTIVRTTGAGVPADGRFHHVVATKDGPRSARIFVDGAQQPLQQVSPAQVIEDTGFRLTFSATPTGDPVAGDLDEFAVYDRALTADEVARRHGRGTPSTPTSRMSTRAAGSTRSTVRERAARAARAVRSGRPRARGTSARTAAAGACAAAGTTTSGIAGITVGGPLSCAPARALALAGPRAVAGAGLDCSITGEDFSRPVVQVRRDCRGAGGLRLRYTTRS